jgi:hypothetical protein
MVAAQVIAPVFRIWKLNSRSRVFCWTSQVRVTWNVQGFVVLAPTGDSPTLYAAVVPALFQIKIRARPVRCRAVPAGRNLRPESSARGSRFAGARSGHGHVWMLANRAVSIRTLSREGVAVLDPHLGAPVDTCVAVAIAPGAVAMRQAATTCARR